MRRRAEQILTELGQDQSLPLGAEVRELSAAQRQLVEIAKALALNANLIIFDEPTASLSPGEVERLFDVITRLKASGCAVAFVSHRLEEVFAITDRLTVLREGRTVAGSVETRSLNQTELIRLMVGRDIGAIYSTHRVAPPSRGTPILSVRNLKSPPLVRDVSFDLHAGEILGLGGLVGRRTLRNPGSDFRPEATRRAAKSSSRESAFRRARRREAIRAGIGFVAEDRRRQSIVPDLSVKENLLLGHLGAHRGFGLGYGRMEQKIAALAARLDLPAHRIADESLLNFSGGMQQKIIIARWLLLEPKVMLLDEPTKGVDIGTRSSIYAILREIAAAGTAIVVVSSEFEELIGLTDRVIVMSDGQSIANVASAHLDEEKLTLLAAPRSSMERNQRLLSKLAKDYDGAAFWAILDESRMFCLNAVAANSLADPNFTAGATPRFEETRIGAALSSRSREFIVDPTSGLQSLVVDVKSHRGHELGTVGLVLDPSSHPPEAMAVRAAIVEQFRATV